MLETTIATLMYRTNLCFQCMYLCDWACIWLLCDWALMWWLYIDCNYVMSMWHGTYVMLMWLRIYMITVWFCNYVLSIWLSNYVMLMWLCNYAITKIIFWNTKAVVCETFVKGASNVNVLMSHWNKSFTQLRIYPKLNYNFFNIWPTNLYIHIVSYIELDVGKFLGTCN